LQLLNVHPVFIRNDELHKVLEVSSEINDTDILHVQHVYSLFGYSG